MNSSSVPMNRLRICHIASGDLWAGAEAQVFNITAGLTKLDRYDITAIIMNRGKLYNDLVKLGIDTYLVNENEYRLLRQILMIRDIISKKKIEIMHSHRYKENIFAGIVNISVGKKMKLVKTQHGSFNMASTYRMRVYRAIDLFFTKYLFDKVIGVSKEIANQFRRFLPESKIATIHNSICFEKYDVSPANNIEANSSRKCLKMAIIGRLVKIKNIDEFIEITVDLKKDGLAIESLIIGDGPEKARLKRLVKDQEANEYIKFLGTINKLSNIYNLIDILFITSIYEGIPTVLLEAMYFRKIVIARNVGGIPEVINHNYNGFIYNYIKEATNLTKMIYNRFVDYEYIRVNARKTVENKYSNLAQANSYAKVYES